ncbi:MAG: hypothetical protein JST24_10895 [Acidobacteria bacterium]|nr:hypothetical protein [Acidobacteriota bacterium]
MSSPTTPSPRLDRARQLVQEKGLSKEDLVLLEEILQAGELDPLLDAQSGPPEPAGTRSLVDLRRSLGLFLAFLAQFSPRRLGDSRAAMGLVIEHGLARLGRQAKDCHRELLQEPGTAPWVGQALDLVASLRAMALSAGTAEGLPLRRNWAAFLTDHGEDFREVAVALQDLEDGSTLATRLHSQLKTLNRNLRNAEGRSEEALRKLADLLESATPLETRRKVEPLLLVEHVVSNLRLSLRRPLEKGMEAGIHWPAVTQIHGSLQWLWNHLGWQLPRVEAKDLQRVLPREVRKLLQQIRKDDPAAFRLLAKSLGGHLAVMGLLEGLGPFAHATEEARYAAVAPFLVVEGELGRMAERTYSAESLHGLKPGPEAQKLRGLFRQAALSQRQDQSTVRALLQQALAASDTDQLAVGLDNLRALLLTHQKNQVGDLVGVFSPDLRQRLYPESVSLAEEGDRLRQRLHRLYEGLTPLQNQLQLHLELQDWPRLALGLAQGQQQASAFRRSPEFPLIRPADREEADRLIQLLARTLDAPSDVRQALVEGTDLVAELLRFLELLLLRINARAPLIRHDLEIARGALDLCVQLKAAEGPERNRLAQKLLQTAKRLGVRDPQSLVLLKRWVRAERSQKDQRANLDPLAAHLDRLAARLDAALG